MADKKPNEKVATPKAKTEKTVEHKKNGVPQLETVEPTDNSQSERKEVSADAPVTNPETGDFTPKDFKVVDYLGKTDKQIEKEHQDGLMEQLNRTSDDK